MKHDIHLLLVHSLLIAAVAGLHVQANSTAHQQLLLPEAIAGGDAANAWLALLGEGGSYGSGGNFNKGHEAPEAPSYWNKVTQGYRSDVTLGGVGLWAVVVMAVLLSLLACCCLLAWSRELGLAPRGVPQRAPTGKRSASQLCQPTPRSATSLASQSYLASSSHLSQSVLGAPSPRTPTMSQAGSPGTAAPLCPQLVVPDSSKLQCMLPDTVKHERQNIVARICSSAARGGVPLFQARVVDGDASGIHLETLRGEERMASVNTQMVWSCPPGQEPTMEIYGASGAKHATMTKNDSGGYTITCVAGPQAVFAGQFAEHDAQVVDAQGRTIAEVSPGGGQGTYEVVVFPKMDAGLIILGLLTIDKMESEPSSTC